MTGIGRTSATRLSRTVNAMPDICDIYMAALDALDQIDNPIPTTDEIPF